MIAKSDLKAQIFNQKSVSYVTLSPEDFTTTVQHYIDLSPVSQEWNKILTLQFPSDIQPPKLFETFSDILKVIQYVCSTVEVAKRKLIAEHDPDGSKGYKFDNAIALGTAIEIISSLIQFKGPAWLPGLMTFVKKVWKPALNIAVSVFVSQQPIGWVAIALQLIQVAAL